MRGRGAALKPDQLHVAGGVVAVGGNSLMTSVRFVQDTQFWIMKLRTVYKLYTVRCSQTRTEKLDKNLTALQQYLQELNSYR